MRGVYTIAHTNRRLFRKHLEESGRQVAAHIYSQSDESATHPMSVGFVRIEFICRNSISKPVLTCDIFSLDLRYINGYERN